MKTITIYKREILVRTGFRMIGNGEFGKIQNSTAYGVMNGRVLK